MPEGSITVERGAVIVRFEYDPDLVRTAQKIAATYGIKAWRAEKRYWRFPGELAEVIGASFPFPVDEKFAKLACKVDAWATSEQTKDEAGQSNGPQDSVIMSVMLRSFGMNDEAAAMEDRLFATFRERHAD
jgi:hypothetical protein